MLPELDPQKCIRHSPAFDIVREASNHVREGLLSALGLKLQNGRKERVEVLVIDRVERPEAN
jgi:uncharacterized protein (TIGR03435 family)